MSSQGLLILNPGHIDPGFKGPISICAINLSKENFKINIGDDAFTLIISDLSEKLTGDDLYKSSYDSTKRYKYEKRNNHTYFILVEINNCSI